METLWYHGSCGGMLPWNPPCPVAARLLQGVFFEAQVPQEGHGRRLRARGLGFHKLGDESMILGVRF